MTAPICTCGQMPCRRWRRLLGACPGAPADTAGEIGASVTPPCGRCRQPAEQVGDRDLICPACGWSVSFGLIPVESDIPGVTIVAATVDGAEISKADADRLREIAREFSERDRQDPGPP